jgi:hypothetical protein
MRHIALDTSSDDAGNAMIELTYDIESSSLPCHHGKNHHPQESNA